MQHVTCEGPEVYADRPRFRGEIELVMNCDGGEFDFCVFLGNSFFVRLIFLC